MNPNQLRLVRAFAEAGTFTGGAARCFVTQSTLYSGISRTRQLTQVGRWCQHHFSDGLNFLWVPRRLNR